MAPVLPTALGMDEVGFTGHPGNATDRDFKEDGRSQYTVDVIFILMLMVSINVMAVVGNLCVMAVVGRTPHLRSQLTYIFVLNLCVADLLCSLTVLPVAIATYALDSWPLSEAMCNANGFLSGVFTLTSISSICVISIERYYSIKLPMHYAAHMTLQRSLIVIAYVWFQSGFIALFPLLGWNSYQFQQHKALCSFSWNQDPAHKAYVILLAVLCFILPSVTLITMYCAIYSVAKQTANQIGPRRSVSLISNCAVSQFPFVNTARFLNGSAGSAPTCEPPCIPQISLRTDGHSATPPPVPPSSSRHQPSQLQVVDSSNDPPTAAVDPTITQKKYRGHWKAMKTVVFIMSLFMVLWGPYFIMNIIGAVHGQIRYRADVELFTTWLGFSTFAINPFIYGWLNRTMRDAFFAIIEDMKSLLCRENNDIGDEMTANEDFFQFLERTSTTRTQSIPMARNGVVIAGNPPILEELETVSNS